MWIEYEAPRAERLRQRVSQGVRQMNRDRAAVARHRRLRLLERSRQQVLGCCSSSVHSWRECRYCNAAVGITQKRI